MSDPDDLEERRCIICKGWAPAADAIQGTPSDKPLCYQHADELRTHRQRFDTLTYDIEALINSAIKFKDRAEATELIECKIRLLALKERRRIETLP
jgi:hypothetical protein